MKPAVFVPILLFLVFLADRGNAQPTSYLPVTHRAYDFLERMELKRYFDGAFLGMRPITRLAAAKLLDNMKGYVNTLSPADRNEYACLLAEFGPDLAGEPAPGFDDRGKVSRIPGFLGDFLYRNRRNLYSAYGKEYSLFLDPVVVRTASMGSLHGSGADDNVFIDTNGFALRGTVGGNLGFFVDVRDSREWGSRDYPRTIATTTPGRGYVSFKGDHAEFDETNAHLTYTNGPFALTWGRGQSRWGRGASGTLGLSSYAAPVDFLRFETSFWRLRFVFLAGELEQFPPVAQYYYGNQGAISDSVAVKKRMSAHRVELNLTERLAVGLYETVVYGGRYEWSYLNPLMFLKGAEHANGDHDNAAIGMDMRYLAGKGAMLYGEFFIDDITTSKLGTDWYGNKLAFQAGMAATEPFGIRDIDARLEYTRINPWVYTHRLDINSYTHYGDVLGHVIGPNADNITMILNKRFSRRLHTSVAFNRTRHGANPSGVNVGGDSLDGFSQGDSTHAKFLAGIVTRTNRYAADISYEIGWQCFVKAGYTYEDINGDGISMMRFGFALNE